MTQEIFEKSAVNAATLEYFCGDEIARDTWVSKYALKNNADEILELTPRAMHVRLAREFARVEKKYKNPLSEVEIFSLFDKFRYVIPQGSPMSAIGNKFKLQSVSNCFVVDSPCDSYGGILHTDQELVQIMKRRGGVGVDISTIRPQGVQTANAAGTTDGVGVFMERFSNTCREVAQGGRRGALMLTIDIQHPQVETFVNIKRDLKKITGANVSVRVSDAFMRAVKSDSMFVLKWPVNASVDDAVVKQTVRARVIWDEIIGSAHTTAEPGVLFWNTVLRETPADAFAHKGFGTISVNPCAEIGLSSYSACRLLLLNLSSYVNDSFKETSTFNFDLFKCHAKKAQRLMDDVVDLELEAIDKIIEKVKNDEEPAHVKLVELELWIKIRERCESERRTGLGVTALADTIAALGLRYGSAESVTFVNNVYRNLAVAAHESSVEMALERGSFPAWEEGPWDDHPFFSRLEEHLERQTIESFKKNGRRNICLTTTSPAGSVSVLTQTSSGIEPVPFLEYTRRRKIDPKAGVRVDFVDDVGDSWQEYVVTHVGLEKWKRTTGKSAIVESPYFSSTCNDIDWKASVDIQSAAQRWTEHSLSKTHNLPKGTTIDVVNELYIRSWTSGCKGTTIYVEGSRSGVIIDTSREEKKKFFVQHSAPKRSHELKCNVHHVTIRGEAWTILVGLFEDNPYEVFGGLSATIELPKKHRTGSIFKHAKKTTRSVYDLAVGDDDDALIVHDIVEAFSNPTHGAFTRTISLALRHGAPIQYVCEQLMKDDKDSDMFSFSRVIARVLKQYVPDGSKTSLEKTCKECNVVDSVVFQEGCLRCKNCGWSRC